MDDDVERLRNAINVANKVDQARAEYAAACTAAAAAEKRKQEANERLANALAEAAPND